MDWNHGEMDIAMRTNELVNTYNISLLLALTKMTDLGEK
jgi:hypothetical protein